MPNPKDVAVFVGSLRKESFTRKVVRAAAKIAPPDLKLLIVEIGHLGPYNQESRCQPAGWVGKPAAVLSVSPGAIGAFGANHHLRAAGLVDDSGGFAKPETREFVGKFLAAFAAWIDRNGAT